MKTLLIAQTTVETIEDARRLAALAVESGHAACVQIDPGIESVYVWKNSLHRDSEVRLTFKLSFENLAKLEATLLPAHPYEVPEWVHWSANASDAYANWVQ